MEARPIGHDQGVRGASGQGSAKCMAISTVLEPLQQFHQGAVIKDPANAVVALIGRCEIVLVKQDLGVDGAIAKVQMPEGRQAWPRSFQAKGRQQAPTGMGEAWARLLPRG